MFVKCLVIITALYTTFISLRLSTRYVIVHINKPLHSINNNNKHVRYNRQTLYEYISRGVAILSSIGNMAGKIHETLSP